MIVHSESVIGVLVERVVIEAFGNVLLIVQIVLEDGVGVLRVCGYECRLEARLL